MFSIYAVGVVKGYKRETSVRIHAVVDYRSAPSLANLQSALSPTGAPGATSALGATSGSAASSSSASSSPDAINAALQPSVGGQVLYYSID